MKSKRWISSSLVVYTLVLTCLAAWVVWKGANDEPYMTVRPADLYVQVGLGTALICLWLQLAAVVSFAVFVCKWARAWLVVVLWTFIVLFYLWESPFGYVHDIMNAQKAGEHY